MNKRYVDAQVIPYPKLLRFEAAANRCVRYKSTIHGLVEIDVTKPRAIIREHKVATGESLSFTAFLTACLAKAVDEHKTVQAFRQGGKRRIVFDDVDINIRVERDVDGQKFVVPYIIRAANRKTVRQVHEEIRAVQTMDANNVLHRFQAFLRMPSALYGPFLWVFTRIANRYPRIWKKTMGTVGLTAVGMFAHGAGWGVPATSPTALLLTVGGIGEKPTLVDGHIDVREYLSLTISVDHDIVDGAPATRFAERLKELIESGYGLAMATEEPARTRQPGTRELATFDTSR